MLNYFNEKNFLGKKDLFFLSNLYHYVRENKEAKYGVFVCDKYYWPYEPFEAQRKKKGTLTFYVNSLLPPTRFKVRHRERAFRHVSTTNNLVDLRLPDRRSPRINTGVFLTKRGGDAEYLNDLLIFCFSQDYDELTVLVFRNGRKHEKKIWKMFQNGEFDEEIATMSMFMGIPEGDPSWFDPDTPQAA